MSASTTTPSKPGQILGGGFLLRESAARECFIPEEFSEEQRQVETTANEFMSNEVLPRVDELEKKDPQLLRELLRKAGELGLFGVLVPEEYGGLDLDLTTAAIVTERCGRYASFSSTIGSHSGIGTLPLVYFGTEEQKKRYLPRLVTAETAAAYCLSEPQAGSDALAARTQARLSGDGKHYILNGEKMWITNGAIADLYTVFAKVDGEKFTAFLVERAWEGVSPGAEERKMGIHGSSTTPLALEDVKVPVENVLGEVGRGHVIAFNILNVGRLKLGVACVGGGKEVLAEAIRYAKQRKAFGRPIADFGMIRHKLAEMAIRLYALESLVCRTCGLIDAMVAEAAAEADKPAAELKAAEEYAVECSIAKVYGSEALDYIVDEAVQIHGGYGFHQDYMVERAYRDSRINRIFEGTNEINRLLTTGMLLKRAARGRLPLMEAVEKAAGALAKGETPEEGGGPLSHERNLLGRAKTVLLAAAGAAYQRFGAELEEQQEVTAALSDIIFLIYAAESALLRAEKLDERGHGEAALEMTRVLVEEALTGAEQHALAALAACAEGGELDRQAAGVREFLARRLVNTVALRRRVASRLTDAEKYVV